MTTPTTRRYARTLHEAFPFGPSYGAALERPNQTGERLAGFMLAVAIGVCIAAALVSWWSA